MVSILYHNTTWTTFCSEKVEQPSTAGIIAHSMFGASVCRVFTIRILRLPSTWPALYDLCSGWRVVQRGCRSQSELSSRVWNCCKFHESLLFCLYLRGLFDTLRKQHKSRLLKHIIKTARGRYVGREGGGRKGGREGRGEEGNGGREGKGEGGKGWGREGVRRGKEGGREGVRSGKENKI